MKNTIAHNTTYIILYILIHSYNDIRKDHSFKDEEGRTISLGYSNETIEENFPAQRADADYFPFWCFVISFPVLMVFLVLHLILHDLYIFGVIVRYIAHTCPTLRVTKITCSSPGPPSAGSLLPVWQWCVLE